MAELGSATILALNPNGLGFITPRAAFLSGSASAFQCSYFDTNGNPLAPSGVNYQIDDLLSGENILGPTGLPVAATNTVVITPAQNALISLSRSRETHALTLNITDANGGLYRRRALFELVRAIGIPFEIVIDANDQVVSDSLEQDVVSM